MFSILIALTQYVIVSQNQGGIYGEEDIVSGIFRGDD